MKDELGQRIKTLYEDALRIQLPHGTYVILRIDGKNFHTFTRDMERPYDRKLAKALDQAALALAKEMKGCRFAYGQSDEYSFLLTDFETAQTRMWFDGNLQKMVSVSASLFTAHFLRALGRSGAVAAFDSRLLIIPQRDEVAKYFLWRQLDASANSLNMLASSHYTHEDLLGKSDAEKHDLLHDKGVNWAKEGSDFKRGRVVRRGEDGAWLVDLDPPIFQREPEYLNQLIP